MGSSSFKESSIFVLRPNYQPISSVGNMALVSTFPFAVEFMHLVSCFENVG